MLERAYASGVLTGWVTTDEADGQNRTFRGWLAAREVPHVLATRTTQAANRPSPPPAPPSQPPRTPRTRQRARTQPFLDPIHVRLYGEHRASERTHTALPRDSGQEEEREGRGLPRPEDRHGGGADEHRQHDAQAASTSARSTAADQPYVVILGGG
jgi:hypothetical protein